VFSAAGLTLLEAEVYGTMMNKKIIARLPKVLENVDAGVSAVVHAEA
jgi:hypothetical protein